MTESALLSKVEVPSYWKSKNHYDPELINLGFFTDTKLTVEEKIDGSQFSFGFLTDRWDAARMVFRSKNKHVSYAEEKSDFSKAIRHLYDNNVFRVVPRNVVFRCEFVGAQRQNKLKYERVPNGFLVMFGAENISTGKSVPRSMWKLIARDLNLDTVDLLGHIDTHGKTPADVMNEAAKWLGKTSQLGGTPIEGVVLKRETNWILNHEGTPVYAKIVADEFREIIRQPAATKGVNANTEIIEKLVSMVQQDAVFSKAVQHLTEEGLLTNSDKDIGPLIREVQRDVGDELAATAKEVLWEWAKAQVLRGVVVPFAKWYKQRLLDVGKEIANK